MYLTLPLSTGSLHTNTVSLTVGYKLASDILVFPNGDLSIVGVDDDDLNVIEITATLKRKWCGYWEEQAL